nr:dTDP-4-dehydrorhamnose 3,5-epimerase [Mycolicibacterium malmesburyense]CRL78703.1 dTDP-4-dehydrorhamnose 3,5-epimerase [Mycolicibacterium malmesburyense]
MNIIDTEIPDLKVVRSSPHRDARGSFVRFFCAEELQSILGSRQIAQINHSRTSQAGAVRGLHFQWPPYAEMKLVRCVRGRVWDVVVDLRRGSSTFLQWRAQELAEDDARMLVIPEGFAHGFQALEPHSELLYLHTAPYKPESEGGVRYDDPRLSIAWPRPPQDLSDRDLSHPLLSGNFTGVVL